MRLNSKGQSFILRYVSLPRALLLALGLMSGAPLFALSAPKGEGAVNSTSPTPAEKNIPAAEETASQSATKVLATGDWGLALAQIDAAIANSPSSPTLYEQRGGIYVQEKLWPRAVADYATALKLAPGNSVLKYDIGEVFFMQRSYENAILRFQSLKDDPNFGDLALYKIFLCDLFCGRADRASADMYGMSSDSPSYFFSHAVWGLFHGNNQEASQWLYKASSEFGPDRYQVYMASLVEAKLISPTMMSFTTRDGTVYDKVMGFVEGDGLRVDTSQGNNWVTLPFDQLPQDLSVFPTTISQAIKSQEMAAFPPGLQTASFVTKNGQRYDKVPVSMGDSGLLVKTPGGEITLPFDQLPTELSCFGPGLRAEIASKISCSTVDGGGRRLSFVTCKGVHYTQVQISIDDDGLRVLTPDGWVFVAYSDLPPELPGFPAGTRDIIKTRIEAGGGGSAVWSEVSFTTTDGKSYQSVQAALQGGGLAVKSAGKLLVIPLSKLPQDLSGFPLGLKDMVDMSRSAKQQTIDDSRVSFTTRKGQHYDQVHVMVEDAAIRVLTSDGWVTVPLAQLPAGLVGFPAGLRDRIVEMEPDGSSAVGAHPTEQKP
jgi:tetratricopeptide (TPR) repeat protein